MDGSAPPTDGAPRLNRTDYVVIPTPEIKVGTYGLFSRHSKQWGQKGLSRAEATEQARRLNNEKERGE